MGTRLELHEELVKMLGSKNVYFQPPESVKFTYPCIIYNLSDIYKDRADNLAYNTTRRYSVMFITKDPDDDLIDKFVQDFKYCRFDRYYTSDNLNHYTYDLFY